MAGETALGEHTVQSAKVAEEMIVVARGDKTIFTLTDHNLKSSVGIDVGHVVSLK